MSGWVAEKGVWWRVLAAVDGRAAWVECCGPGAGGLARMEGDVSDYTKVITDVDG